MVFCQDGRKVMRKGKPWSCPIWGSFRTVSIQIPFQAFVEGHKKSRRRPFYYLDFFKSLQYAESSYLLNWFHLAPGRMIIESRDFRVHHQRCCKKSGRLTDDGIHYFERKSWRPEDFPGDTWKSYECRQGPWLSAEPQCSAATLQWNKKAESCFFLAQWPQN